MAYKLRDSVSIPESLQLFEVFFAHIATVVNVCIAVCGAIVIFFKLSIIAYPTQARPDMAVEEVVALQVALIQLARKCYPADEELVDRVLAFTGTYLTSANIEKFVLYRSSLNFSGFFP